ncbi:hypothetical protein [Planctomycetes bacterium CA13]|uniref:hypothetical protein n=1 Tax=Novipirellula herctigrandis TaxID=2527986 RepID=UPI0011B65663
MNTKPTFQSEAKRRMSSSHSNLPSGIRQLLQRVVVALCLAISAFASLPQTSLANEISGGGITVKSLQNGTIEAESSVGKFTLRSNAEGCVTNHTSVRTVNDDAVEVVRGLEGPQGQTCQVTEQFTPTANSIRWTVTVEADGEPWTVPITLDTEFVDPSGMQFWRSGIGSTESEWRDPLKNTELEKGDWVYGRVEGICLPLASVFRPQQDAGLSLICSPEDVILDLNLQSSESGIRFVHGQHRLGNGRAVTFHADLVSHPADCRGALVWMTTRYASMFNPPVPAVHAMAGCGAYSAFDEVPDVEKMKKMAFRINWWAYFDWPYLGMNLPPMSRSDEPWVCCDPYKTGIRREMTYDQLNEYARNMKKAGFFALNYFTTTEFGTFMKGADAVDYDIPEKELWKDCNSFAFRKIKDGILMGRNDVPADNGWKNGYGMDAGGPNYRAFLVEQAKRQVEQLPEFSGICVDRLDWLQQVNRKGDDGVSFVNNRTGRSVRLGWMDMMDEVAAIFHDADKVIFANLCNSYRVEVAKYLDGVYDEFGHMGPRLNASALLCLRKPLLAWTPAASTLGSDPDGYFQRHLHLGAYPTAPYPLNNHTITPNARAETQYMDYGPLLDAIRGKTWVLFPHCVTVADETAKANLFEVPDGWVLPVTFASDQKIVKVIVRNVPGITSTLTFDALHPGVAEPKPLTAKAVGETVELQVPIHRGCAMVRLRRLES